MLVNPEPPAIATIKDAFISYNKADEDWARSLAEMVERETMDGSVDGRKLTVFFAPWDIEHGGNIVNRLNDGLREARFFVPVLSPEFFGSGWTNLEWTDQVALDPKNSGGRIIPIFWRDLTLDGQERISLPAPFGVLNRLDFREENDFEPSFRELIRILQGLPKQRGSPGPATVLRPQNASISTSAHEYALPSATPELLVSNLLKIEDFPGLIWSAATKARKPADVWNAVETKEAFLLRDERLFAFADISDPLCSLHKVIDEKTVGKPESRADWLKEEDGKRRYVELLNRCLTRHLYERKIGRDEKGRFYFWPDRNQDGASITRHFAFDDEKPRDVAARKVNEQDGSFFWVHYAARIRFEMLGDVFFLRIEPTYIFTTDGRHALDGKSVGRLSIQWSGKQQNPDVLRAVLFWARVLADGRSKVKIPAGAAFITAHALPATARAAFGVGGDYIRIQALLQQPEATLDEIVDEAEVFENDADDCGDEDAEDVEEAGI